MRSLKRTKGVSSIRKTRVRKFRKRNFKFSLLLKSLSIAYLCLLVTTISTNDTNAFLSHTANSSAEFKAQWEQNEKPPNKHVDSDKSSLEFKGQGGACNEINATIINGKDSGPMKEKLKYEIFYINKGNPKNGEMIFSGEINPLTNGQEVRLTFKPDKTGNYMFKAYQHKDHSGKGELWSKEIQVSCENPAKPKENIPSTNTETKEESSTPSINNKQQEESIPSTEKEVEEENIKSEDNPTDSEIDSTSKGDETKQDINDSKESQENGKTNDDQN